MKTRQAHSAATAPAPADPHQLSPAAIDDFAKIMHKDYGVLLTPEQAREHAAAWMDLVKRHLIHKSHLKTPTSEPSEPQPRDTSTAIS